MKQRILITGANGLLGQSLVALFKAKRIDFLATSLGGNRNPECDEHFYSQLDVTNKEEVTALVLSYIPTAIIHTAAMTNVDLCEKEVENCKKLNIDATEYLLDAAILVNAHFQLLSTDFVFDGEKGSYKETDEVNPLSVYARSKVEAENLLHYANYQNTSIARTIILYGVGRNLSRGNIILWAKEQLENGKELSIVNDQFRAPTFAPDLAQGCLAIIEKEQNGIFHLSGPDTYSMFEIVQLIAEFWKLDKNLIKPTRSEDLAQAALRPSRTGFNLLKARQLLEYDPLTLEESFEKL